MDFSTLNIVRGIFTVFVVLGAVQPSQSFQYRRTPSDPFIVVEGVSNLPVALEWELTFLTSESVLLTTITRNRPGEVSGVTIAGSSGDQDLVVSNDYSNNYAIRLPSTLLIKSVTNADEYVYTFAVTLTAAFPKPKTSLTTIVVFVPPQITQHPPRTTRVNIGQNVSLLCNASGDPLPNITWTRDGVQTRDFNVSGHVLHLVNVQRNDTGSYRCTATNGYGNNATRVGLVSINCPGCESKKAEITINQDWKSGYSNPASEEYKDLESLFLAGVYGAYAQQPDKGLSRVVLEDLRSGSVIALVEMLFPPGTSDPFKPLRDEMRDGKLGPYLSVNPTLNQNPTSPPPTASSTGTTVAPPTDPGQRGTDDEGGLGDGVLAGIIVGCVLAVLIIVFIIVYFCCCKKKNSGGGGATKVRPEMQQSVATHDSGMGGVKSYSEEDAYAMNRGPPANRTSHSAGIGSPAYVEASMYAPANASRKQEDQPKQLNYADLSFNNSSAPTNMPPRYSGTEYSEPSPSRRPPQGEGAQPGEKGFELWC